MNNILKLNLQQKRKVWLPKFLNIKNTYMVFFLNLNNSYYNFGRWKVLLEPYGHQTCLWLKITTTFYGPYKRSDGGKLKGHERVVIRFQGQERAFLGPYCLKGIVLNLKTTLGKYIFLTNKKCCYVLSLWREFCRRWK